MPSAAVRFVDAGVGAYPSRPRLDDEMTSVHGHDPPGLAQNEFYEARVLAVRLDRLPFRERGGRDRADIDHPALGLRDDLLANGENVAVAEREAAALDGGEEERG